MSSKSEGTKQIKREQHPVILPQASRTIQMSKLAKQKSKEKELSIKTLGKLVATEIHDTQNASDIT
jgi:hypothetical protein